MRSQDKEKLIKVSILFVEYNGDVDPTMSSHRIVADKCIDLGIYKTKERALEVLDEIQDILKPKIEITKVGEPLTTIDRKILYVNQESEMKYQEVSTYVYEMPEE